MDNLRKFNYINDYNTELSGDTLVKPNVSLVVDAAVVKYLFEPTDEYRWINLDPNVDYMCNTNTYTKYYKQQKQVTHDGYIWEDVVPAEYRRGDEYETKSRDCGYMPKVYAKYLDGKEYELQCNSSPTLWQAETRPSGYNYSKMYYIAIGDCVTRFDDGVLQECASLEDIIIPTGITSLGQWLFKNCTKLKHCKFDKGSQLTNFGLYTFSGCTALESIEIPSGVTEIGYETFSDCISLSSVTFSEGISRIIGRSFENCISLETIVIPNSITKINDDSFKNCSGLTSVDIGSGVTSIGGDSFNYCTSLEKIIVRAITPPNLSAILTPFNRTNNCPIYVPDESLEQYKTATNWIKITSRLKPISELNN